MVTKFVEVLDYDPVWPKEFEKIKAYLHTLIPKEHDIIHVGSTSVVFLSAKPIIDLDVIYGNEQDKILLIHLIEQLGYQHEGDLGITNREAFTYQTSPFMKHHLYLVKYNSKAYKDHLYLKEYLSQHENEKNAYSRVKKELAEQFPNDINAYMRGKEEMISRFLTEAYDEKMEKIS